MIIHVGGTNRRRIGRNRRLIGRNGIARREISDENRQDATRKHKCHPPKWSRIAMEPVNLITDL